MSCSAFYDFTLWTSLAILVGLAGCGGDSGQPTTVPVSGTVMFKGEPVDGATVSFWTEGAPRAATGVSNANGEFRLSMFRANDGAVPGENKITVTKASPDAQAAAPAPAAPSNNPSEVGRMMAQYQTGSGGGKKDKPKSLIPERYTKVNTTPLKETVTASGPNQFVLQLTD